MRPAADRFHEKVSPEPNSGCWLWTGYVMPNGYGRFGGDEYAHRVSLALAGRKLVPGLEVHHLCNVRSCVNPEHLVQVTHAENQKQKQVQHKSCSNGHDYSIANTYWFEGKRLCRACRRAVDRRRRAA